MAYSQANWRKKGLGWIPDLPDVSDPTIPTVVGDAIYIQSAADSSAIEETINLLIDVLKTRDVDNADIQHIKTKLLGDTRFPRVKVYTILRKSSTTRPQKSTQLQKEIVQLKLALYLTYRKTSQQAKSNTLITSPNIFVNCARTETLKPANNNNCKAHQAGQSDDINQSDLNAQEHRKELEAIFEPKHSLKLMEWLQNPIFDDSLEVLVIDFQRYAGLIGDGIVGPKTITAISVILADSGDTNDAANQDTQTAEFLCPLTLIPHDVLKEIFQQLTHQWLYEKFRKRIDSTFEHILGKFDFEPLSIEKINQVWNELDGFIREELHAISTISRDYTAPYQEMADLEQLQDILDVKFTKIFSEVIKDFCSQLSSRCQQLFCQSNIKLSDCDRQEVLKLLIFEASGNEATHPCFSIKGGFDDSKRNDSDLHNLYQIDFIFCRYPVFITEFKRWFRVVEPFVAAILQTLSPLGSFDNFKQAVKISFDRLEGCFQLHQLTNASIASSYRNLIVNYSPNHLVEQVEELKIRRETVIHLFKEVATKIDRNLKDDLIFRKILLECSDFSDIKLLNKNEAKLKREVKNKIQHNNYFDDKDFDDRWQNFIWPIANNIYKDIHHKAASIEDPKEKEAALKKEVERQIKDVECFISFLKLFESIIKGFLFRYNTISSQEFSDAVSVNRDFLSSSLTAKEEIFEIVSDDLPENFTDLDRSSGENNPANRPEGVNAETAIAPQFLDPIQLKLPVNFNLLNLASQTKAINTRYYFFLPGVVDLSYWCSPVEDQGTINACTAFAGIALVEYFTQKRYGKYTNLSARFLYKAARNLMSHLYDDGASVRKTMEALVLFGVPPEDAWPWNEKEFNEEPPAFCYAYAQSYQALKYFRLDTPEIPTKELLLFQIKAVLAAGLPCMFGFTIYSSFFKEKSIRLGHVTFPGIRDQIVGGHAAVAVGYNDYILIERLDGQPAKPGAILIRNSWGTEWGKGGYGWLPYEYVLEGLTADWWSLLKSEWLDGGAFGIGAVDPGGNRPTVTDPKPKKSTQGS